MALALHRLGGVVEPIRDTDVEHEKLRLEQERLALDRENLQEANRFMRRNSSVIIASFVPLVVAAISLVQVRNSTLNDRRERLINYVKFINENVSELRSSDDVTLHRQTAYMTSAVLDPEDRCPTLAYIANTVAKNRTIREIYEREADTKNCPAAGNARALQRAPRASLIPSAAAGTDEGPHEIRAIYVYRQRSAGTELTNEVRQGLNGLGYNVPGENDVDSKIEQNEIRYFNKRDAPAAATVQSQLAKVTGKSFVVNDYSKQNPGRPGFLEVYLAE